MRTRSPIPFLAMILLLGSAAMVAPRPASGGYPCEGDLLEIMFAPESRTRLRDRSPADPATDATAGVDQVVGSLAWHRWSRLSHISEESWTRSDPGERRPAAAGCTT